MNRSLYITFCILSYTSINSAKHQQNFDLKTLQDEAHQALDEVINIFNIGQNQPITQKAKFFNATPKDKDTVLISIPVPHVQDSKLIKAHVSGDRLKIVVPQKNERTKITIAKNSITKKTKQFTEQTNHNKNMQSFYKSTHVSVQTESLEHAVDISKSTVEYTTDQNLTILLKKTAEAASTPQKNQARVIPITKK